MLRKGTLNVLHRIVDRAPFSGRTALVGVSRLIGTGQNDLYIRPGIKFSLDLSQPYHLMIFAGDYESALLRTMARVIRPGDIFVDGGANIGLHALVAARCVGEAGHVWAFEPDPLIYPVARHNVDLNPRLRGRVTLAEMALSRSTERLSLIQEGVSQLESHAVRGDDTVTGGGNVKVNACRIDDVVPDDRQAAVAGMKLDIEGFEVEALSGALNYLARPNVIVICELNDPMLRKAGTNADALIGFLRERGFSSRTVEGLPFQRHDPSWPDFANAIFYKGEEATRRVEAAR